MCIFLHIPPKGTQQYPVVVRLVLVLVIVLSVLLRLIDPLVYSNFSSMCIKVNTMIVS